MSGVRCVRCVVHEKKSRCGQSEISAPVSERTWYFEIQAIFRPEYIDICFSQTDTSTCLLPFFRQGSGVGEQRTQK